MKKRIISITLALLMSGTAIFTAPMITSVFAEGGSSTTGGDSFEDTDGISVSKYVNFTYDLDSDGEVDPDSYEYTLNLEVFTTGTVTETVDETIPSDIVLVLDQSTSMMWPADQPANMTYGDAETANNVANFSGSYDDGDSISNNVGIVDGEYKLNDDGQYEWVQAETVTVSPITVASGTTSWISSSASSTTINTAAWNDYDRVNYGYLYSESRQKEVIDAVLAFIYSLDDDAGHRISIVTYHNEAIREIELTTVDSASLNTIIAEVIGWASATNTGSGTSYEDGTADSVNTFNLQDSTLIALGVEEAEEILFDAKYKDNTTSSGLEDLYVDTGRTQLSVIFTDGIPTQISATGNTGLNTSTANNVNRALEASVNMKQDGVTVFSIGMLNGVYSDVTGNTDSTGNTLHSASTNNSTSSYYNDYYNRTTYYITEGDTFISSFLDLLSSNYTNASSYISSSFPNSSGLYDVVDSSTTYSISTTYSKSVAEYNDNDTVKSYTEYYYPIDTDSANVADELSSVFTTVAGTLTANATYELDQTAQVRDVMTSEFTIPVDFEWKDNDAGDYDKDENGAYYYVGLGYGDYLLETDISLYISYSTGKNLETAEDYSSSLYDSGYYTWDENTLIYDTTTGNTGVINEDLSIVVRNVYVNPADESTVYYYEDVAYSANTSEEDGVDNSYYYVKIGEETVELYETQMVIVQGFDYNKYYVTTTDKLGGDTETYDYGAKLVIEFEIEPDTDALGDNDSSGDTMGGNSINTNTSASGVYIYDSFDDDSDYTGYHSLESFQVPNADIPINVTTVVEDQTIYLGNAISIIDLVEIDNTSIDGESNKYVDITYTLYETTTATQAEFEAYVAGISTVFVAYDNYKNEYYKYAFGDDGNRIVVYEVVIPAATDIANTDDATEYTDSLITPTEDIDYLVEITVSPLTSGTVGSTTIESQLLRIYVLHPSIDVNDVWVDYATPVDLREDNIISIVDESDEDTYNTLTTSNISWETVSSYDYEIPEPNNEIPPTVEFGYTARRGIEYTADEFYLYGVREDKEFYISSMTITSSDGYNNTTRYDSSDDYFDDADYESIEFSVNINKYDLEISKTVDADTYDTYPQSFVFDLTYTDTEFITAQKYAEGTTYGLTLFENGDSDTVTDLFIDTTGYYSGETEFAIYTNIDPKETGIVEDVKYAGYYDITSLFFTNNIANTSDDDNYIDQEHFIIYYNDKAYESIPLYEEDGETPVYELVSAEEYEKTLEVIIDPDMSNVETVEWTDASGTRYYTFNVLVTDLYCGVELDITEDTSWAWRYTPGFTTTTTTQYADYVNNDGNDTSNDVDTTLHYISADELVSFTANEETVTINRYDTSDGNTYVIANIVKEDGSDIEVRTVTIGPLVDVTILDNYNFDSYTPDNYISFDDFLTAWNLTATFDTTSVMSVDSEGNITQTTTTDVSAYKIIDYDEEILARIASQGNYDTILDNGEIIGGLGDGLLGTYQNTDDSEDYYLDYEYAYYLTEYTFNTVAEVTTSKDGSSATILVTNSEDYLDKNGSDDYDDWTRITEEQNTYLDVNGEFDLNSESTTTMYATVSAVYFDISEIDIDVYNSIVNEYWLSYSALAENIYSALADPTTQGGVTYD